MPDRKNATELQGTSRFRPRWMKAAIGRIMSFGHGHRMLVLGRSQGRSQGGGGRQGASPLLAVGGKNFILFCHVMKCHEMCPFPKIVA